MFPTSRHIAVGLSSILFMAAMTCHASVIISGTRVIYNAAEKEVSVKLTNTGSLPVLVQNWIDNGDANEVPERIRTPFTLSPPINRINASKSQTLRISYTDVSALPEGKESLFWLNVLEVPASSKNAGVSMLQVAYRTRIKLFYRPSGLNDRAQASSAAENIKWKVSGNKLIALNSSPYYVSLASINFKGMGKKGSIEGEMVSPQGSYTFTLPSSLKVGTGSQLTYEYINDWGALKKVDATL